MEQSWYWISLGNWLGGSHSILNGKLPCGSLQASSLQASILFHHVWNDLLWQYILFVGFIQHDTHRWYISFLWSSFVLSSNFVTVVFLSTSATALLLSRGLIGVCIVVLNVLLETFPICKAYIGILRLITCLQVNFSWVNLEHIQTVCDCSIGSLWQWGTGNEIQNHLIANCLLRWRDKNS